MEGRMEDRKELEGWMEGIGGMDEKGDGRNELEGWIEGIGWMDGWKMDGWKVMDKQRMEGRIDE